MENVPRTPEEISASITRYYDLLTDQEVAEVAEDRAWGEFAALQFRDEECWNDLVLRV
jgi:hypothetical protein